MSMVGTLSSAHDIEVVNADGKTIYYNYNSDKTELSVSYDAYLNKYSNLIPSNNKYNWTCEFCSHENKDLIINKVDLPLNDTIEKSTKNIEDVSSAMYENYNMTYNVAKEKYNEDLGSLDEIKKLLKEKRKVIQSLGPINVNAIE